MAVHYVGDNGPDGVCVGTSSTELVGFFGATPIVKPTSSSFANAGSSIDVLTSTLVTSAGFNGSAAALAVLATINALCDSLHDLGLIDEA